MDAKAAGSTGMTTDVTVGGSSSSSNDGLQHHPGTFPFHCRRSLTAHFAPAPPAPAPVAPAPPALAPPVLPGVAFYSDSGAASDASTEVAVQQKGSDSQPGLQCAESTHGLGSGAIDDSQRLEADSQSAESSDKSALLRLRSSVYNKHANLVLQFEKSALSSPRPDSESDSRHVHEDAFCAICFLHPLDPRNTVAIYHFQNQEEGIQQHSERFCRSCLGKWAQRREFELPKGVSMVDHEVVARLRESIASNGSDVDTGLFYRRRQIRPMRTQDDETLETSDELDLDLMERGELHVSLQNHYTETSSLLHTRDGTTVASNDWPAISALAVPSRHPLYFTQTSQGSASASSASSPALSFLSRVDSSASTTDQSFSPNLSSQLNAKVSFSPVPSDFGSAAHPDHLVSSSQQPAATVIEAPSILTAALREDFRERAADNAQTKNHESDNPNGMNLEANEFLKWDKSPPVTLQERAVHSDGEESEVLRNFSELKTSPIPPVCPRVQSQLKNPLDQRGDQFAPSMNYSIPSPVGAVETANRMANLPGPELSITNPNAHQPLGLSTEVPNRKISKTSDSGVPPLLNYRPKRTPIFFENTRCVNPQFVRDARALGLERLPTPHRNLAKNKIDSSRYGQVLVRDSDAREAGSSGADFVLEVDPDYPLVCPICNRLGRKVEVNLLNRCVSPSLDCGRAGSVGRAHDLQSSISNINCNATAAPSSSHGQHGLTCGLPEYSLMFSVLPLPSCVPPRRLFLVGEPEMSHILATNVQSIHDRLRELDRRFHKIIVCGLSLLSLSCLSIGAGCLIHTFTEDPHW